MKFLKDRLRARRILRWQAKADACSDSIAKLSIKLQNMDQITHWELAESIRAERAKQWQRRNDLYTRIKENT